MAKTKGKLPAKAVVKKLLARKAVTSPAAVSKAPLKLKTPLSKSELAEFRALLLAKRRSIVGDMNGIQAEAFRTNRQEGSGDLSNMPTHPADVGTDNFEQEFTLGLLESERQLLREINEALERIESGTYGVCLGTGKPIGDARLKARPWAKYCIEYARLLEKGLVRPGDSQRGENGEEVDEREDEEEDAGEEEESDAETPSDDVAADAEEETEE
jgi:RNA polymerase-binding protein DksA